VFNNGSVAVVLLVEQSLALVDQWCRTRLVDRSSLFGE
jgi:hypothetical protein